MKCIIWAMALLQLATSCEPSPSEDALETGQIATDTLAFANSFIFPYDIKKPDATLELPSRLKEISGLSLSQDGAFLLAVNDESGKIFFIDKKNGKVEEEVDFEKNGDYEGIEAVGDKIYVVKSNGTIYKISDVLSKDKKTKTLQTDLSTSYDVEGLGYDEKQKVLLLACKGKAGKGDEYKDKRAVYAFDLDKEKLLEKPVILIDLKIIGQRLKTDDGFTQKIIEIVAPEQAAGAFAPSGIAVHPATGDIYLVASVGKILVVLNPAGKILHIEKLDKSLFKQPEGICFDSGGTMYISTEGRGGKGKIFKFQPH